MEDGKADTHIKSVQHFARSKRSTEGAAQCRVCTIAKLTLLNTDETTSISGDRANCNDSCYQRFIDIAISVTYRDTPGPGTVHAMHSGACYAIHLHCRQDAHAAWVLFSPSVSIQKDSSSKPRTSLSILRLPASLNLHTCNRQSICRH